MEGGWWVEGEMGKKWEDGELGARWGCLTKE